MDLDKACLILRLKPDASARDVEAAKRKLLGALHPDRHRDKDQEIFAALTRDVVEAADYLLRRAGAAVPPPPAPPRRRLLEGSLLSPHTLKIAAGIALLALLPLLLLLLLRFFAGLFETERAATLAKPAPAMTQALAQAEELSRRKAYTLLVAQATAYAQAKRFAEAADAYAQALKVPGFQYDERAMVGLDQARGALAAGKK